MSPHPFVYSREIVSRSYVYNYGGIQQHYAHFGIFLDDKPIGCFQLKRMDPEKQRCEFGIILQNGRVKGKGYGTEAVRRGMRIARDQFRMRVMIGDTLSVNIPMVRVFEKLGFTLTETVPDAVQIGNASADRLVYEIEIPE